MQNSDYTRHSGTERLRKSESDCIPHSDELHQILILNGYQIH
jgi:hypothetical protein